LGAQRCQHFTGIEIVFRNLVRVQPDAHRVFASALELHVAYALQTGEGVLDVQRRVVREIERVSRTVGRVDVDR
jgi:hypothetical protein